MTSKIFLMCGIPASGKSTWISEAIKFWEDKSKAISRDAIRFSLLKEGEDYFKRENAVFAKFIKEINDSIAAGIDYIYIDATHINPTGRTKVLKRLRVPTPCRLSVEVFLTPLDICIERNDKRTGLAKVPVSAIKSMAEGFEMPTLKEFEKFSNKFSHIQIFTHEVW